MWAYKYEGKSEGYKCAFTLNKKTILKIAKEKKLKIKLNMLSGDVVADEDVTIMMMMLDRSECRCRLLRCTVAHTKYVDVANTVV